MLSQTDRSLQTIAAFYRADEAGCLQRLCSEAQLSGASRSKAVLRATRWIEEIRRTHKPHIGVTDLLARLGLSSQEGLALMCLAEALLRIPDRSTADALIRDKLGEAQWDQAIGTEGGWAMNAAGWALAITGSIIQLDDPLKQTPGAALKRLISRLGQPVIREAIKQAMEWLADQFVMGEDIDEALKRALPGMENGTRYSFDMLGEGARTAEDAEIYFQRYIGAIEAIGKFQKGQNFPRPSGLSVKLSALHPRYEMAQRDRVLAELVPKLVKLCQQASYCDIPLTIDAEEADRLQLSLEVIHALVNDMKVGEWDGLGFAVQAYQKRAPAVIDFLANLARSNHKKFHIRLVKGAYWDAEIKRAQERGWKDFPVFTRKASTDVSYHACAARILKASDVIKPLFGTHNALTVAHITELAGSDTEVEFQRLHGMGEDLHGIMQREGIPSCIYAPVGNHDVLLGYLVRRILENGANSSFVNRLLDSKVPVEQLVADPVAEVNSYSSVRHPNIRTAPDLYPERRNSEGIDLNDPFETTPLLAAIESSSANPQTVNKQSVEQMFMRAQESYKPWSRLPVNERAICLEKLSDLLEQARPTLMHFIIEEGGKTVPDALGEVREAVDFCRYYAAQARQLFIEIEFVGVTGEQNRLRYAPRGVFVCISPWNFPLAIFLGQVVAALVTGNCVIAKPSPQTPKIAAYTRRLILEAGVPEDVFQLAFGGQDIGAEIIAHPQVAGVAFTGSTATARKINQSLAAKNGRIVPLIAETGGQNAMIVDGSALLEQVVDDVITSAFRSAGQRCSALRVLCLPVALTEAFYPMLKGAMQELRIGDPALLKTDIGPVIDNDAKQRLNDHLKRLQKEAKQIAVTPFTESITGNFIQPQAWEIPSIAWLTGEVFGPILHIVSYKPDSLPTLIQQINATDFGLTGGLHSRIESTAEFVERELNVGNLYINRSMIGAVVGMQPFGGEGLSGTGPKAGGPNYLHRFVVERVTSNNTTAAGGNASLLMQTSN